MKALYYDCFSGISGDMNIGALLDLGVPFDYLQQELEKLGLKDHYRLIISRKIKMGIEGTKFDVELVEHHSHGHHRHEHGHSHDEAHEHHQDDHEHKHEHKHKDKHHHEHDDHGHKHEHQHDHKHDHADQHHHAGHDHSHAQEHDHDPDHGHGEHVHRGFTDIKNIIEASSLDGDVKDLAIEIFHELAVAEAKVHGTTVDEVHFHEVGAIDAIVDIVGAAICFYYLKVERVYSRAPETGSGFVKCAHGIMPVPAPATAGLLAGIPFTQRIKGEATTPTGAAILRATVDEFNRPEDFVIERIGYGLGTKEFEQPNVLRVYLGNLPRDDEGLRREGQFLLETNIDDMNPEYFGSLEEKLFGAGALDVYRIPIHMKKGRLGIKLSVLYGDKNEADILRVLFSETTTIGVRRHSVDKLMLKREHLEVTTPYGTLRIKRAYYEGKCVNVKPEYDDLLRMAREQGISVKDLYPKILSYLED